MIKLTCIKDVIMNTGVVAFKAGEDYNFNMNCHGEISRTTENGVHMFSPKGIDAWTIYFKYSMEVGNE
jgi:hypothetical protein